MKLLDGATGTMLWALAEKNGVPKVPVWRYNIEHPEFVEEVAREYIDAGSDMILTNTFDANRPAVRKNSEYTVEDVIRAGVAIAHKAAEGRDVKICFSVGPLSELLEPFGDLEEDECREVYAEMIRAGVEAGVDVILLETFMDAEMLRIAAEEGKKTGLPVFCTMSFEKSGKTMFGNSVDDILEALEPVGVDAVGLNCSYGPETAVAVIESFHQKTALPLILKPNAGLPVSFGGDPEDAYTPERFINDLRPVLPYVSYVGGCCGSSPGYIKALRGEVGEK